MTWHGVPLATTSRDDWLERRRATIGASDVAGILGLSPWSTPFSVWYEKTHAPDDAPTETMSWGLRLENVILDAFEEEDGLVVANRQLWVAHPRYEWVTATVDGIVYEGRAEIDPDPTFALGNIEAKQDGRYGVWSEIPDHYQIQGQWQMLATGFDNMWFAVLHGGNRFKVYEYRADRGVQNMILDKVSDWRATHITGGVGEPVPPEADGSAATAKIIGDLWEPDDELTVTFDASLAADVDALRGWKAELGRVESEVRRLESKIKLVLGEATVGLVNGSVAVTWKPRGGFTRPAVDVKPGRMFLVKEQKE